MKSFRGYPYYCWNLSKLCFEKTTHIKVAVPAAARSKAQVYGSSPAEIVGSNPTGGMDVCCVCCQVEVSATEWSFFQRSPTECGASFCVIKKPRERGGHSPRWAAEPEKIKIKNPCKSAHIFLYVKLDILQRKLSRKLEYSGQVK
jgi:hypothetical protein